MRTQNISGAGLQIWPGHFDKHSTTLLIRPCDHAGDHLQKVMSPNQSEDSASETGEKASSESRIGDERKDISQNAEKKQSKNNV